MKKVRIFFGIALVTIAVAAAAATNARTSQIQVYYYDNQSTPECVGELIDDPMCVEADGSCKDGQNHELYLAKDGQFACSRKLKKN